MEHNERTMRHAESIDDCGLQRSERNRYFHGKLMSARDMQAEQRYYRGLHTRHSRHVIGQGVVSGLDVRITEVDTQDADFEVEVDAGYAIDGCGRPIVVPGDDYRVPVSPENSIDDRAWLYLEYDECVLETVPVAGSEDACEQDCEYNRVLEDFDIRMAAPTSDSEPEKPVPPIEFPSPEAVQTDEAAALDTIAREFLSDSTESPVGADAGTTHAVFLGEYRRRDGGWQPADNGPGRNRVYTNDMLYAATARHTANFENPHQVTLEITDGEHDDGVSVYVPDDWRSDRNLDVVSADGSVAITLEGRTVDLSVEEYIAEEVGHRTADLEARTISTERHAIERSLQSTDRSFAAAATRLRDYDEEATSVADFARSAVDARLREDTDADAAEERSLRQNGQFLVDLEDGVYPELFEHLYERIDEFANAVEPAATNQSNLRLERAMGRLEDAIEGSELGRFGPAQDDICYAVDVLKLLSEVFEPGDYVLDSEDDDADPAVVIHALDVPIDDWTVHGEQTVADQNPDYSETEPVVIVTYEDRLEKHWESWANREPEDLFDEVTDRGIKFHAFPASRLEHFDEEQD